MSKSELTQSELTQSELTESDQTESDQTESDLTESDLTAQLAAFTTPMTPPVLPVSDVAYVIEETAIGRMLLARNESGAMIASAFAPDTATEDALLTRLSRRVSPRVLRQPRALDEARRELETYLSGARHAFDLPTAMDLATPFQRLVLERLAKAVPYGGRTTYGALAKDIQRPSASRAVGTALGANPLCVLVPCHRVVARSGALTGYAGGLAAKEYLLNLESRS